MTDLTTSYLGLKLKNPLVASSSPLCEDVSNIRRLEDAGASAVVLHSLFQEQIEAEAAKQGARMGVYADSSPEALTYFPEPQELKLGPEEYLKHIAKAKKAVRMPPMCM